MGTTHVTVERADDLLQRALVATGEGVAATIQRGLEMVVAAAAQQRVLELRGQAAFSIDLEKLRDDRG